MRRLSDSERLWQDWVRLLNSLHTELRYTVRPVQEMLAALNKREFAALPWLSEFGADLKGGVCPQGLCDEERAFACEFFSHVGTSDLAGQLAHIEQYRERATALSALSSERRRRLSKVYLSTAVCFGISIGIMVI